ncbi:MAG: hypothetical protein JSV03_10215, partial [Planctomycetota bacterium]
MAVKLVKAGDPKYRVARFFYAFLLIFRVFYKKLPAKVPLNFIADTLFYNRKCDCLTAYIM